MFKNLFGRFTVALFVTLLIANVLLLTAVYSVGITTGYEGVPSWSWDSYTDTMGSLFGSFSSLVLLLIGVAFFAASVWIAVYLSKKGRHNWVGVWYFIGLVGGGAILYLLVDWSSFGFGFIPVIALIVFTTIEALIGTVLANRLRP